MYVFWHSERGSISVEYTIWLAVMVAILMLAADASMLLSTQSEMYDVARDVARQLALGVIENDDVDAILQLRWPDNNAYTWDRPAFLRDDYVVVEISIPFKDVVIFGDSFASDGALQARVVMAMEST